ncbi:MAG: methyltransferase domain-containing protein [Thermoanaerobaculia bacterium]|nr:methyltransferase domain-containing protein [Thermoanaerobaculia bacterium]
MATLGHNDYQRQYYSQPERKRRMRPIRSRYVLRHLEATLRAAGLAGPGSSEPERTSVLEMGCGMGRFTHLLTERGFDVTAVDLSSDLLSVLGEEGDGRANTICCDAAEVHRHVEGPFDAVLGFFFLHHLENLEPTLCSARAVLRPGGKIAFCEPNAFHLPFYLQILLTPSMTWNGDRGVVRMRAGLLRRSLEASGFEDPKIERYGLFPPAMSNRSAWAAAEEWLERRRLLEPVLAFQVVSAGLEAGSE